MNYMTTDMKELEQVLRLLKKYSKMGISKVHYHGITIELNPSDLDTKYHRPKRNATSKALATKPDGEESDEDMEFRMSQLRIDDPEAYEEFEIKRMRENGE